MNDAVVERLSQNGRHRMFALDLYRRFLHQFGVIVQHVKPQRYEKVISNALTREGVEHVHQLSTEGLAFVIVEFKSITFIPDDVWMQLRMAIAAMFRSWESPKYNKYSNKYNSLLLICNILYDTIITF
jgi:pyruvate,orthophosphate dikinase